MPRPEFTWPHMAASRIADSLGIYIPPENLHLVKKPRKSDTCCEFKEIRIGAGIEQAVEQAGRAVFAHALMLGERPSDTYIKSLDLRGLLHLRDVTTQVEFVPYIKEHSARKKPKRHRERYNIIMSLDLNFSAISFRPADIREFSIDVMVESESAVGKRGINAELRRLCDTLLEKAAFKLARKLVVLYGARI